ncbi:MAG: TRAP transporter large permease [Pseudomonadota bacterium]|nr:TRAP transporter large permease [Pseudomonadota bacterium]
MSDIQVGLIGLVALLALIALRLPIGVSMIVVSFVGLWNLLGWNVAWGAVGTIPYQFSANWILSSVPMFLLMGFVAYHAQLTRGLFQAARVWLTGVPGGMAIAAVLGCAGFASVSGSSVACSAAMGRIVVPEMMRQRYSPELATGTVAVGGTIGALIPPSIIMILYGVIANTSVTGLFLGGISAGILTVIGYIAVILIRVRLKPELAPRLDEAPSLRDKLISLTGVWPLLVVMIGIFGGLFSGFFTPTEAGAVGAFLTCLVAILMRTMTWQRFRDAIIETLVTTAGLIVIATGASLLTRFLALSGVGPFLSSIIIDAEASTAIVLIGIALIYLLLGLFLEPIGAMLLTLPIVLPIISAADLSLLWFGIVLTKLLEVGMITPPIGMNVFIIKGVVGNTVTTTSIFRGVFWFLIADLLIVALLMAFPNIVLFLPRLL